MNVIVVKQVKQVCGATSRANFAAKESTRSHIWHLTMALHSWRCDPKLTVWHAKGWHLPLDAVDKFVRLMQIIDDESIKQSCIIRMTPRKSATLLPPCSTQKKWKVLLSTWHITAGLANELCGVNWPTTSKIQLQSKRDGGFPNEAILTRPRPLPCAPKKHSSSVNRYQNLSHALVGTDVYEME